MIKQRKGHKITTNMRQTSNICSEIVDSMVDKLVDEYEEDRLFFEEIEKCKEYIREVQNQIGYVWQTPTPSLDPTIHEDSPSFVSPCLLQSKLSLIKLQRPETSIIKKRTSSHLSRASSLRYSYQSKASANSISQWGQLKFNLLKKENESKLKDRKKDKKACYQKLKEKKETEQQNEEDEKFIREYLSLEKKSEHEQKKRKHRRMRYVQKKKLSQPDDGSIPMLIEMNVNITQENSQKHLPLEKAKKSLSLKSLESTSNNNMPSINHRCRQKMFISAKQNENTFAKGKLDQKNKNKLKLRISDYQNNKNQIIINDWDVFNHIIDFPPSIQPVMASGKHYSKMNITIDSNNLEQTRKSSLHIYIPQY